LGKHRAGRPRAREVEHVLERMDGRFTSGATQVNFKLRSAPLPPTSTLVLPRRLAPKATTGTPSGAAHVSTDQLAQQVRPGPRWALLAGVFAFLLGGVAVIALWPSSGSRGDPRPVTPTVAPPALPVVAAVDASVEALPLVVRPAVDAGVEELTPLVKVAVKPLVKPTAPAVICDDRWRRAVIQELRDLHAEVARKDDDALFIRFEKDEERVLDKLNLENVSTSAGCVEADTAATRLLTRYRK